MKKTKWFLGTGIVMALLVIVAVFTKQPTQATAAETAKEEYHLEQVGTETYIMNNSWDSRVSLRNEDGSSYTFFTSDGKIAKLDNSETKYSDVEVVTSSSNYNVAMAYNDDNKVKFVTYTGKEYAGGTGFHDSIGFTRNLTNGEYAGSYYTIDDKAVNVYDKSGKNVAAYNMSENARLQGVIRLKNQVLFYIYEGNTDNKWVDKFVSVDNAGTVKEILSGNLVMMYYSNEKVICIRDYSAWTYKTIYLNGNLEEISEAEGAALIKETNSISNKGFQSINASTVALEDGYYAVGVINRSDLTIYYGKNANNRTEFAYFSPSGKMLIKDSEFGGFINNTDFVLKKVDSDKPGNLYNLYQVLKSGESLHVEYYTDTEQSSSGSVENTTKPGENTTKPGENTTKPGEKPSESQTTIANEETVSSTTVIESKEDGTVDMNVTLNDVDGSKEDIKVSAEEGVIPANTTLTISKIKKGETFDKAQKAVEAIADKVTVFEIDLFNTENVKIQPNGNIRFTLNVPTGYDSEKISVYRIEEDGTYTKMESEVVDGKVTFVTNHFSTYVITEDKDTALNPNDPVTTGDTAPVALYVVVAFAALATLFVVSKKKIVK